MKIEKYSRYLLSPIAILLGILILSLFLRLQGVFSGEFAYTYDVGRDMLALHSMVVTHKIPLIGPTTGEQGVFYGPWWYYILFIPFLICGGNPVGISFFMALLGVLTTFLAYLTGKQISTFFGLIFALFICISQPLVTSQIWNPYMAWPVIMFLLYVILKAYRNKENKQTAVIWFFLIGICLELILDSEIFFGMLFDIGFVIYLIIFFWKKLKINDLAFFILGFLFMLSPRILFDVRHQFLNTKGFIHLLTSGLPENNVTILTRLGYLGNIFTDQWSNTVAAHNVIFSLLILISSFVVLGMHYKKINILSKKILIFPLIVVFVFFVYFLKNTTDVFGHFIIGLPIMYVLFLVTTISVLKNHVNRYILLLIVAFIFLLNLNPISFVQNIAKPDVVGDESYYKNQLAAVKYVYAKANGESFNVVVFTPTIVDYSYQYLLQWYPKTIHAAPVNPQAKLTYYILEPDRQYNGLRLRIFLAEHKNDGKIISQHKFPSGILFQKRINY